MVFQCINIRQVPWEAFGRGFQHLPQDLANVNAWKTMFDRYINSVVRTLVIYVDTQTSLDLHHENIPV